MMYKICFITTVSMTLTAFVKNLAEFLYKSGQFEIYFICNHDEEFKASLPDYINYIPVTMSRGITLDGFKAILDLRKIFKENKFDIIQYSTPNASCYASIAGYLAKIPVRLYCQWGIAYVGFFGIKRRVFKLIEKMVCYLSTWIEPDSQSNLDFSHEEGLYPLQKGGVIWNGSASGVDLNKFDILQKEKWKKEIRGRFEIPLDAFVYIFIGRITGDKGINELYSATKMLLDNHDNAFLLMVGGNEVSNNVDRTLYEWSIKEERVIYTGFTTEVEKYVAAADVYVLPSYREGFGSSVIEAEAMGVPVIITNIPGPINAMQKDVTGLIVEKKSIIELNEAMSVLKNNAVLRDEMGGNAFVFARDNFNQKILFQKILEDRIGLISNNYGEGNRDGKCTTF